MAWWRRRRAVTAGLGLFALLLQLTFSFGHIHLEGLSAARTAGSPASGVTAAKVAVPAGQQSNRQQLPAVPAEDDCLICLTMHMAASGVQPMPPIMFVPVQYGYVLPPTIVEKFLYRVPRHALFQTRAPPIA